MKPTPDYRDADASDWWHPECGPAWVVAGVNKRVTDTSVHWRFGYADFGETWIFLEQDFPTREEAEHVAQIFFDTRAWQL
jgi:hypothetical protein